MLTINFNPFPELKTERLLLRRMTTHDAKELFFLRSDKTVLKYINKAPAKSLKDVRDFILKIHVLEKNNEGINWVITMHGNKKLIGNICLWNLQPEHYRGELGYVLHPSQWGKGIMQEATEAVLDYGFKKLGLHSIEAHVNPANQSSIKLLERNHFVREAYLKENYFFKNKFLDTAVYSLQAPAGKIKSRGKARERTTTFEILNR